MGAEGEGRNRPFHPRHKPDYPVAHVDRSLFAPAMRFRDFIMARERSELEALGRRCGMTIHTLSDLERALELEFEKVSDLIVAVKIELAYMRTLRFGKVTYAETGEVFNNIYTQQVFKRVQVDTRGKYVAEGLSLKEQNHFRTSSYTRLFNSRRGTDYPYRSTQVSKRETKM